MSGRLLVVDDDASVRRSLSETLTEEGYKVRSAESAEEALTLVAEAPRPDVVLSDVRMPGLDGLELLELIRERSPSMDVILITAYDEMPAVVRAMREGALDFLVKPLDLDELLSVLERAFRDRRARERERRETEEARETYRLDAMVGRDPKMLELFKRVGQLAASPVTVLIRGETGTGKEMVARAIHYASDRADEPFLAVNCTALPEPLLESELFGHVRGAFTGAISDRRGRFALAGRGTLFLDEIGDTSPEFQAKLLRVLEERRFHPVGAERAEETEARVMAATHRDLEEAVEEGTFREDLYYRLRVVELRVPPLRERRGDVPLLARHLVRKAATGLHVSEPTVPQDTLEAILRHDWPGNVRELENCLTRGVVLARGQVLRPEHLFLDAAGSPRPSGWTLDEVEGHHVARVLEHTDGNRTRAAELLGISKPRLYRLLDKHGLR